MQQLTAHVWRRGRGIYRWTFNYIERSDESYFTTPGWYRSSGRGRMYRITIDHDYPAKPIWLGFKRGSKWYNAEGLYEVLLVTHSDFLIANNSFRGAAHRSSTRRVESAFFLRGKIERALDKQLGE